MKEEMASSKSTKVVFDEGMDEELEADPKYEGACINDAFSSFETCCPVRGLDVTDSRSI